MADGISYYFQVTGNQSQYFQCNIQNPDCGRFECYPTGDDKTALKFVNDNAVDSVSFDKTKLEIGQYYRVQITEDYKILLSEYSEDGKVGKELFNLDLEKISTKFMELDEDARPDVNETNMQYKVGGSAEQVFVDDKGKIKDGTEAAETIENTAGKTTTTGTTTTKTEITKASAAANADTTSETAVVTTTTNAEDGLINWVSKNDGKMIVGSCIAVGIVAVLLIVLVVKYFDKEKKNNRTGRNHESLSTSTHQDINKPISPVPSEYREYVAQDEWEQFMTIARRQGLRGKDAVSYAEGLALELSKQRMADKGIISTYTPPKKLSDVTLASTSKPRDGEDNPSLPAAPSAKPPQVQPEGTGTGGDDDGLLAQLAQASAAVKQKAFGDGSSSQTAVPTAPQPDTQQSDGTQSEGAQFAGAQADAVPYGTAPNDAAQPEIQQQPPVVSQPAVTQPAAAQYANEPVSAADCVAMANGAKAFTDERQFDGSRLLHEASDGVFFSQPYADGRILMYLNPAKFPANDPFYNYGISIIAEFYTFDQESTDRIQSVRAAVFEPDSNKPGYYRLCEKGDVQLSQQS